MFKNDLDNWFGCAKDWLVIGNRTFRLGQSNVFKYNTLNRVQKSKKWKSWNDDIYLSIYLYIKIYNSVLKTIQQTIDIHWEHKEYKVGVNTFKNLLSSYLRFWFLIKVHEEKLDYCISFWEIKLTVILGVTIDQVIVLVFFVCFIFFDDIRKLYVFKFQKIYWTL